MSLVTNVVLSFSIGEEQKNEDTFILVGAINDWLVSQHGQRFGVDADRVAGGSKHLETPLYIAAFNYLFIEDFLRFVFSLPWEEPENVQVFIQGQDEDRFTVYDKEGWEKKIKCLKSS